MLRQLFVFSLLLSFCYAANKVQVKLYFEALCPGCSYFIQNQLKPVFNQPDLRGIADLAVYPAGNNRCSKQGSSYSCTCQHGEDECLSNQLMDCVIDQYPDPDKYLPFVFCFDFQTVADKGAECLKQSNMPPSLLDCANSQKGVRLQYEMFKKTPPEHQYVPWVTINGRQSSAAQSNLKQAVCNAYTGRKPPACSQDAADNVCNNDFI